jgi:hypothetical protein
MGRAGRVFWPACSENPLSLASDVPGETCSPSVLFSTDKRVPVSVRRPGFRSDPGARQGPLAGSGQGSSRIPTAGVRSRRLRLGTATAGVPQIPCRRGARGLLARQMAVGQPARTAAPPRPGGDRRGNKERLSPHTLSERPGPQARTNDWRRRVAESSGPEVFPNDSPQGTGAPWGSTTLPPALVCKQHTIETQPATPRARWPCTGDVSHCPGRSASSTAAGHALVEGQIPTRSGRQGRVTSCAVWRSPSWSGPGVVRGMALWRLLAWISIGKNKPCRACLTILQEEEIGLAGHPQARNLCFPISCLTGMTVPHAPAASPGCRDGKS